MHTVIVTVTIVCIRVSPPLKNTTPSFLPSPPLYLQSDQAPPFLGNSLLYIGFSLTPPKKLDFSVNPKNLKVFHR